MAAVSPNRSTVLAFVGIVALGGFNGIAITYSNEELAPFWGAALRFGLASAVLFALVAARRVALPSGRALIGSLLYGLLGFGVTFALGYAAIGETGAGLAQVLLALVPLLTLLLAVLASIEAFRLQSLIGTLIAVVGIVLVFGDRLATDVPMLAMLTMIGAALGIAASSVIVKRFPRANPISNNAVAMGAGGVLLLGLSLITGEQLSLPSQAASLAAVGWLVIVGSVIVFWLYLYVIERWTASATSYSLLAMPLVSVPAAALIRNEPVTATLLLGGGVVLAGVYIGAFAPAIRLPFVGPLRLPLEPAVATATTEGPPAIANPTCP
jgi:drug/metabolite transporter (DMT)-like permease